MANTGLGRGLGSLIPQKSVKQSIVVASKGDIVPYEKNGIMMVSPDEIVANSLQPRKKFTDYKLDELADSIREHGIIQPLIVMPKKNGKHELIAGERRLRASKKIGLKEVPVIIREVDEQKKLEMALIENIQREELNPIDLATSYRKLMDEFNVTQEELSKRIGKARSSIANSLRLLTLPNEIKLALIDGRLTEGHAKYLVGLDTEVKQMQLFRKILHTGMSVGETNSEIKKIGGTKQARVKINYVDKDKEFAFREFFGSKVEIIRKGKGGQVIIDFFSDEELNEMVGKIKK